MNTLSNKNGLVEAAMIATIASFFAIGYWYLPTALFLLIFLIPAPFIVLITRQDIKYGLFSLIVFSIVAGILTNILFTIILLTFYGPVALAMGYLIKKGRDEFTVIGIGASISILTVFLIMQMTTVLLGVNIVDYLAEIIAETINHQGEAFASLNLQVTDPETFINNILMIFPSLIIAQSMFITLINYYVSISVLRRLRFSNQPLPEFSRFKLPANIVLGAFMIMMLSYLTRLVEGIHTPNLINNVFLIFTVVFFVQGMASVSFFLRKKGLYKISRIFIYVLIILVTPLILVVSLLGLMDSVIDMRKIRQT